MTDDLFYLSYKDVDLAQIDKVSIQKRKFVVADSIARKQGRNDEGLQIEQADFKIKTQASSSSVLPRQRHNNLLPKEMSPEPKHARCIQQPNNDYSSGQRSQRKLKHVIDSNNSMRTTQKKPEFINSTLVSTKQDLDFHKVGNHPSLRQQRARNVLAVDKEKTSFQQNQNSIQQTFLKHSQPQNQVVNHQRHPSASHPFLEKRRSQASSNSPPKRQINVITQPNNLNPSSMAPLVTSKHIVTSKAAVQKKEETKPQQQYGVILKSNLNGRDGMNQAEINSNKTVIAQKSGNYTLANNRHLKKSANSIKPSLKHIHTERSQVPSPKIKQSLTRKNNLISQEEGVMTKQPSRVSSSVAKQRREIHGKSIDYLLPKHESAIHVFQMLSGQNKIDSQDNLPLIEERRQGLRQESRNKEVQKGSKTTLTDSRSQKCFQLPDTHSSKMQTNLMNYKSDIDGGFRNQTQREVWNETQNGYVTTKRDLRTGSVHALEQSSYCDNNSEVVIKSLQNVNNMSSVYLGERRSTFKQQKQTNSSAEIARLRLQLKIKDEAYLSLKDEFIKLKSVLDNSKTSIASKLASSQEYVDQINTTKRLDSDSKFSKNQSNSVSYDQNHLPNRNLVDGPNCSSFNDLNSIQSIQNLKAIARQKSQCKTVEKEKTESKEYEFAANQSKSIQLKSKLKQPTKFNNDSIFGANLSRHQRNNSVQVLAPSTNQLLQKKSSQFQMMKKQEEISIQQASQFRRKRQSMPLSTRVEKKEVIIDSENQLTHEQVKAMRKEQFKGSKSNSRLVKSTNMMTVPQQQQLTQRKKTKSDAILGLKKIVKQNQMSIDIKQRLFSSVCQSKNHSRSISKTEIQYLNRKQSVDNKADKTKQKTYQNNITPQGVKQILADAQPIGSKEEYALCEPDCVHEQSHALSTVKETSEIGQLSQAKSIPQLGIQNQHSFSGVEQRQFEFNSIDKLSKQESLRTNEKASIRYREPEDEITNTISKEDLPANDQSSNSERNKEPQVGTTSSWNINQQQPNFQQKHSRQQMNSQFKLTGEAFGMKKENIGQLINQSPNFYVPTKMMSEPKHEYKLPEKAQNSSSQEQTSQSKITSYRSRAETPIHPNQVVDGIQFLQVQDPSYVPPHIFDLCDLPSSPKQAIDIKPAVTNQPSNQMNLTGQEFFQNVKQTQQNRDQAQVAMQKLDTATQQQNASIQMLKQIQKKKAAFATAISGPKHAKVVLTQNNPFLMNFKAAPLKKTGNSAQTALEALQTGGLSIPEDNQNLSNQVRLCNKFTNSLKQQDHLNMEAQIEIQEPDSAASLSQGFGLVPEMDSQSMIRVTRLNLSKDKSTDQQVFYSQRKECNNESQGKQAKLSIEDQVSEILPTQSARGAISIRDQAKNENLNFKRQLNEIDQILDDSLVLDFSEETKNDIKNNLAKNLFEGYRESSLSRLQGRKTTNSEIELQNILLGDQKSIKPKQIGNQAFLVSSIEDNDEEQTHRELDKVTSQIEGKSVQLGKQFHQQNKQLPLKDVFVSPLQLENLTRAQQLAKAQQETIKKNQNLIEKPKASNFRQILDQPRQSVYK